MKFTDIFYTKGTNSLCPFSVIERTVRAVDFFCRFLGGSGSKYKLGPGENQNETSETV